MQALDAALKAISLETGLEIAAVDDLDLGEMDDAPRTLAHCRKRIPGLARVGIV